MRRVSEDGGGRGGVGREMYLGGWPHWKTWAVCIFLGVNLGENGSGWRSFIGRYWVVEGLYICL